MAKEKKEKEEKKAVPFKSKEEMIAAINKEYGDGSVIVYGDGPMLNVPSISTGCATLDAALGVWGIPKGRISEIYGPEMSGKTTLCLSVIKECQKAGGTAAFIDAEHAFDSSWAQAIGINMSELIVNQPDSGDQALNIAEMLAASRQTDLIVIDSVAALTPQAELDGEIGDSSIGVQARLMSQAMRKLVGVTSKSNCAIIFINQIRYKIGVMFGNPETTPGGNALKFYSSVRLDIRRKEAIKKKIGGNDVHVGNEVLIKVVKNKVAPPFRTADANIYFGKEGYPSGFDYASSLVTLAHQAGIVELKGSWYSFGDMRLGAGIENACSFVRGNEDVMKSIQSKVQEGRKSVAAAEIAEDIEDESNLQGQ